MSRFFAVPSRSARVAVVESRVHSTPSSVLAPPASELPVLRTPPLSCSLSSLAMPDTSGSAHARSSAGPLPSSSLAPERAAVVHSVSADNRPSSISSFEPTSLASELTADDTLSYSRSSRAAPNTHQSAQAPPTHTPGGSLLVSPSTPARSIASPSMAADSQSPRLSSASGSATTAAQALVATTPPSPRSASGPEPGPSFRPPFSGPWISGPIDTRYVPAPDNPLAMNAKHSLVVRLLAALPATTPRDGLALPNAQLVARRALANGSRRPRCWTTTVFPPRIAHNAACEASHLTLVPMPSPAAGDKGAGHRGAKGKFRAKAKGKDRDRVRLPRGQFAIERDVALGWALPRPVDVNAVLGLSGGDDALGEAEAERVFVLAALALAHDFDHPAHLTLWGSTTAVMTSRRIQRFLGEYITHSHLLL